MSWSARLTHTTTGLAIVFAGPVSRLDLTPDVAAHFARLLAAEAASAPPLSPMIAAISPRRGIENDRFGSAVLDTLEAENGSHAAPQLHGRKRLYIGAADPLEGDRQNAPSDTLLPKNMPIQVIGRHALCCDCDDCLNGGHGVES
jgi:hypothetical protein